MKLKPVVLAAAAALGCAPLAAHADPVTIISLGAQALSAAGIITATTATWIAIGAAVIGTVDARRKARKAAAQARAQYNASLADRGVTVLQADPYWPIVYGRPGPVGGAIVAILTSDKTGSRTDGTTYTKPDALKHLVIVWAAHGCAAINDLLIDGVSLGALDANGQPTSGEFVTTTTEHREISLAAGASTAAQPAAVTVMTCWDEAFAGDTMSAGTYSLSSGNTVITNTGATSARISYTYPRTQASVTVRHHLGDPNQEADAYLLATVPDQWTTSDRLRGLTYSVVTLDLENPRFQGGPPNITADLSGCNEIVDTRTGATGYSENNALITRHWLMAEWGYGCQSADIDDDYTNAAANACDPTITLTVGAESTNGPTFTCNGTFTTAESREAVLEDLVESMAGYATYGAKWMIQAGAWTVPVDTLTDDDLDGQIEIVQGGAGMDEIFNTVRGQYIPAGSSVVADFDPYQNAAFLAADGEALVTDISLPFTNHKARCRNLARIFTERNRDSQVIRYPAKLRAFPRRVGERVRVVSAEYGFDKYFRITDWQFGIAAPVGMLMQEDAASNYDLADAAASDPNANTLLPNPWVLSQLTSVAAASGTSYQIRLEDGSLVQRVKVSWAAIADAYLTDGTGFVYVQWRRQLRDTNNTWRVERVPASEVQAFIVGVSVGDVLTIGVWAKNGLGAKTNPVWISFTVTGDTQLVSTGMTESNAMTQVVTTQAGGPISATAQSGLPLNYSKFTQILTSGSFTPSPSDSGNVEVLVTATFNMTVTGSGGNTAYGSYLVGDTGNFNGFNRAGPQGVPSGSTVVYPVTETKRFSVPGNVAITFALYANRVNTSDTVDISNVELRCEVIKK